jgi:hypothetical protein
MRHDWMHTPSENILEATRGASRLLGRLSTLSGEVLVRCLGCHREMLSIASDGMFCADCLDHTKPKEFSDLYDDLGGGD